MRKILCLIALILPSSLYAEDCFDVFSSLLPMQQFNKQQVSTVQLQKLLGNPTQFGITAHSHLNLWTCESNADHPLQNKYNGSIALLVNKDHQEKIVWTIFSDQIGTRGHMDNDEDAKTYKVFQEALESKIYPAPSEKLNCNAIVNQMYKVYNASKNYPIRPVKTIYPWEDYKWLVKKLGNPERKMMMTKIWACPNNKYITYLPPAPGFIVCDSEFCLVNSFLRREDGVHNDNALWLKEYLSL